MVSENHDKILLETDNSLQRTIGKILDILRENNFSPFKVKYIFKIVKERGNYFIPRRSRSLPDSLNDAEIDFLLNKAVSINNEISMICHLGIFTGLRVSEMSNLLIKNIDFESRVIKVVAGKGGKDRFVPLSISLMQHLKAYIGDRKEGYLFHNNASNNKYSTRTFQRKVKNILDICKFRKKLSIHSLRHTYGCFLRRKGMRLDQIQILMGHSSIVTTEIYARIEIAPIKEEFIRMIGFEEGNLKRQKEAYT